MVEEPNENLYVAGTVNGKRAEIIVDTGACENVIRKDMAETISELPVNHILATAGGHVTALGETIVDIELKGKTFKVRALVIDNLPRALILGKTFMVENKVVINFIRKTIEISSEKAGAVDTRKKLDRGVYTVASVTRDEPRGPDTSWLEEIPDDIESALPREEDTTLKITAGKDVVIPAGQGRHVPVKIVGDARGKIEEYEMVQNAGFLGPRGLYFGLNEREHTRGLKGYVRSRRATEVKIYKGTTLAYLNPASPTQGIFTVSKNNNDDNENKVVDDDHAISKSLTDTQRGKLLTLLQTYRDVFAKTPAQLGRTDLAEFEIDVQGARPIRQRPYRVSQAERETIRNQIDEMLANDIIRPSKSPWSSPVVLAKKKDGSARFCIDYRRLNEVTKKTAYFIPTIDDLLTYLGGAQYYSTLDFSSGYWQVPVKGSSKNYTAFATQEGTYEFQVCPFGLVNAPSQFISLLDSLFCEEKFRDMLLYVDDIIVFSKTFDEHIEKLERILKKLRHAGLTLNPKKCIYVEKEVEILGHRVSTEGILVDHKKIEGIAKFPVPKNVKQLRSFLGVCNFYRKFVENFSSIARALHEATKTTRGFTWGEEQQKAFEELKAKLTTTPVLHHFNPNKGCELRVDASRQGLGAILLQEDENNIPHPIAYVSRGLTKSEKNINTITELECLACVWALGNMRHLIYGRPVKIVTDHHALCWLKTIKDPTGKVARWAVKMGEFDYTIIHKHGRENLDVDALSRCPVWTAEAKDEEEALEIPTYTTSGVDMERLQREDEHLTEIFEILEGKSEDSPIAVRKRAACFVTKDGVLYKRNASSAGLTDLLVIPRSLIGEILSTHHCEPLSGHLGISKTLQKIRHRFYWDGLQKDVETFVKGCQTCQARKGADGQKPPGLLQSVPVGRVGDKWAIDLLGPLRRSKSGKTVIVVATDYASKYVVAQALKDGTAPRIANFIFHQIISKFSAPREFVSDQGRVFMSECVSELLKIMGVNQRFSTAYHPQSHGQVERMNKVIEDMLSMYVNSSHTDWDAYLDHVTFAYNTSHNATTGLTPFMVMYGREPTLPTEATLIQPVQTPGVVQMRDAALNARMLAIEAIKKRHAYDKERYDSKHRYVEFTPGDRVRVYAPARKLRLSDKLLLKWKGPFTIVRKCSEVDYEIEKGTAKKSNREIVHVSRLLRYNNAWQDI